jgi:hypothetical protein
MRGYLVAVMLIVGLLGTYTAVRSIHENVNLTKPHFPV